jgi:putative tributyrin esterase
VQSAREDNFVAGLSMGGYGALKLAFTLPEQFAAAASLSGVTDVVECSVDCAEDFTLIFGAGGPQRGSAHDLFQLATSLANSGRLKPRLYQCCGTEDPLYAQNTRFRDAVQELGFDYLYEEGPGDHSWDYCDKMIARTLTWLEQG